MNRAIVVFAGLMVACKSNPPTPPAPPPSASTTAVAEVEAGVVIANTEAADASDEGGADDGAAAVATSSGSPLPPRANGAAWSLVRWDMSKADIESAFEKAGVKVEGKKDAKTGAERVTVRHGSWNGVVYFSAKKPTNIVVTGEHLSKDTAAVVAAKIKERGGAPTQTTERTEVRWRKTGAGTTTVVVANDGTVREEYVRDGGAGNVGLAKLTWGMAPAAVQQALTAAGYSANVKKSADGIGIDPCKLPNAPPDCDKRKGPTDTVVITKGDQEGKASFDDKGLSQIEISGSSTDKGAAKLAELEKTLGKPSTTERATKTQHGDDVAKIELEVKEKQPDGGFTAVETYRPKK